MESSTTKPDMSSEIDRLASTFTYVQHLSNAMSIGDIVKWTYGPIKEDRKLITYRDNLILMEDDNGEKKRLASVNFFNPASSILGDIESKLVSIFFSHDKSFIIFASELLKESLLLKMKSIGKQAIINGWEKAAVIAKEAAEKAEISGYLADPVSFREKLLEIVRDRDSPEILSEYKEKLCELSADAILRLNSGSRIPEVQAIKRSGVTLMDSYLDDGFILNVEPDENWPKKITDAKILLLNSPLDTNTIEDVMHQLNSQGCNVLLNVEAIEEDVKKTLSETGVLAIERVDSEEISRLSTAFEEYISLNEILELGGKSVQLGKCDIVEQTLIADQTVIRFHGQAMFYNRIVLLSESQDTLNEARTMVMSVTSNLRGAVREWNKVYGGGCIEMVMSTAVTEAAAASSANEAYVLESFARALETLPATLARNTGHDSTQLVNELREAHSFGARSVGLDLEKGEIACMEELNITDPWHRIRNLLHYGVEAAVRILNLDEVPYTKKLNNLAPIYDIFVPGAYGSHSEGPNG